MKYIDFFTVAWIQSRRQSYYLCVCVIHYCTLFVGLDFEGFDRSSVRVQVNERQDFARWCKLPVCELTSFYNNQCWARK